MNLSRPFLDYYASLGTSPVSQDLGDLQRHLERRTALYHLLGIPPRFFTLASGIDPTLVLNFMSKEKLLAWVDEVRCKSSGN